MNTTTLSRTLPRSIFKDTRHAIGANTENVTVNIPDRAVAILNQIAKPNRSQFIRQWIAEGIQRRDTWAGLAFRAAIGMRNFAISIFSEGTPSEKAERIQAAVEAEKVAEVPTGGAKVCEEAVQEFRDEAAFIAAKGAK